MITFFTDQGIKFRALVATALILLYPMEGACQRCTMYEGALSSQSVVDGHRGALFPYPCDEIQYGLTIGDWDGLVDSDIHDLSPLNYLKSVGRWAEECPRCGSAFKIHKNPALKTLLGLENVEQVGDDLIIRDNTNLSDCSALRNLLGYPDGPPSDQVGGEIIIEDNAPGCNSIEEIFSSTGTDSLAPEILWFIIKDKTLCSDDGEEADVSLCEED